MAESEMSESKQLPHTQLKRNVFTSHLTPTLISISNTAGNAGVCAQNTLHENTWLYPKERTGGKTITGEEKGGRKEGRERGERKGNTKKKGIKWFVPHYYFSLLPKLLGRFLETAEPVP